MIANIGVGLVNNQGGVGGADPAPSRATKHEPGLPSSDG